MLSNDSSIHGRQSAHICWQHTLNTSQCIRHRNIFPASTILHLPASVISCSARPTDCNFRKISLTVSENSKPYNKYIIVFSDPAK